MNKEKICEHCAYFLGNERSDGSQGGICRRYPPVPMLMQQSGAQILGGAAVGMAGVSPPVDPGYTCGEFRELVTLTAISSNRHGKRQEDHGA